MRASKFDLLKFVARCGEVDVATVAQHFRLMQAGAKVKLWRLTKQNLLEINPDSYKPKTWQLTRSGWRDLRYLQEAEEYLGGTKGLLVSNLTAEVARLKEEISYLKQANEDNPGSLQEAADATNKSLRLEQDLAAVTGEMERLRHDNEYLRAVIEHWRRR